MDVFLKAYKNSYMNLHRILLLSNQFTNFRIYFCAFRIRHGVGLRFFPSLNAGGVEGKRPIQCLAFWRLPKYWLPTPSPPGECVPPPLVRGKDTLAGWGGVRASNPEDARHCSVLYICKSFVAGSKFPSKGTRPMCCLIQYQSVDFKIRRGKILNPCSKGVGHISSSQK